MLALRRVGCLGASRAGEGISTCNSRRRSPDRPIRFRVGLQRVMVAGAAFATLRASAQTITRVVLIGPAHYVHLNGIAVPSVNAFATPLGRVPVDIEACSIPTAARHISPSRCPVRWTTGQGKDIRLQVPGADRSGGLGCEKLAGEPMKRRSKSRRQRPRRQSMSGRSARAHTRSERGRNRGTESLGDLPRPDRLGLVMK